MKYILIPFSIFLMVQGNATAQSKLGGNYTFETECMGSELDGSQTLKTWGNGKNRADAMDQAKKNAVRDIIFKGIQNGKSDCDRSPLLIEPNADKKYQEYFFEFFVDDGEYSKYVTLDDTRLIDQIKGDKKKAQNSVTHGVIVRVKVFALKKKLIADGILK